MQTDVLIVGQGICGTMLSYWLEKEGLSYVVIDEYRPFTPSRAAAGIINPVTGRRIVKTWMIDELLPFALETYRAIGGELGISCLSPTEIIEFFPSAQMRNAFRDRYAERRDGEEGAAYVNRTDGAEYLDMPADEHTWREWFRYDLGYGRIAPCCLVDLDGLLAAARKRSLAQGRLWEEKFDPAALGGGVGLASELSMNGAGMKEKLRYKDILADRIVFCDGGGSFDNPWFRNLPFAPNKGEALIIEIEGLPRGPIFKKGMVLAPWKDGLYWLGSTYEWSFTHESPSPVFYERARAILQEWLAIPFRITDHIASVRPATLERRPFVGFHPLHDRIGILNGMGTKGCSLAPWFARQLARNISQGPALAPIMKEAGVERYHRILEKR